MFSSQCRIVDLAGVSMAMMVATFVEVTAALNDSLPRSPSLATAMKSINQCLFKATITNIMLVAF